MQVALRAYACEPVVEVSVTQYEGVGRTGVVARAIPGSLNHVVAHASPGSPRNALTRPRNAERDVAARVL